MQLNILFKLFKSYGKRINDSKMIFKIFTRSEKWICIIFLVTLFLWVLSDFSSVCYTMSIYLIPRFDCMSILNDDEANILWVIISLVRLSLMGSKHFLIRFMESSRKYLMYYHLTLYQIPNQILLRKIYKYLYLY